LINPERGIAAGERSERALNEAPRRCEAVLFLISKAWLGSAWCKNGVCQKVFAGQLFASEGEGKSREHRYVRRVRAGLAPA
jgi:hypothetical protein